MPESVNITVGELLEHGYLRQVFNLSTPAPELHNGSGFVEIHVRMFPKFVNTVGIDIDFSVYSCLNIKPFKQRGIYILYFQQLVYIIKSA